MEPLKSTQVAPLPVGSGGNNAIKRDMNDINVKLAMLSAQGVADQKFDPPVPKPVTGQVVKEAFSTLSYDDLATGLSVAGVLCIVYGIIAK